MPRGLVVVKGYVDRVEVYRDGECIARHGRLWTDGDASYDPLHYLELLERKPGGLDHARPFEGWNLPECFVCREEKADYRTFLLRLAELETIDRERRAAERRIRAAKFPIVKTIDTFDFDAQASVNRELVRELMRGEYVDRRENVLLAGNSSRLARNARSESSWAA
jgi:hypothetical protein